ncbi:transcription factor bHLH147-like [Canna indica]|uniref:Transcription factor bHLH147-like n=1 Tax=Canna indica TaxID=4628 RepID=A0AAQ3KHW7_9LILI|nr:transcription factor bHLH147-like [Canna indica]
MISSPSPSPSSSPGIPRAKTMKPGPKAQAETKWRTAAQERIYGRRLIEALRATSSAGESTRASSGPRAVKEAADSALAHTARGQSRWSRAILLGRRRPRCKLLKVHRARKRPRPPPPAEMDPGAAAALGGKKVKDRLRVLGRLVPGCRKVSAPTLLEEAADYVAALEMQVKAMRALADALAAASLNAAEPGS